MGCAVSSLDGNGMVLPPKLSHVRPELIPHDHRDSSDENALVEGSNVPKEYSGSDWEEKISGSNENGDLADGAGRRIGRGVNDGDDVAFPGSPSFRVYFKDNGKDKHSTNGDEGEMPKEMAEKKKTDKKKKSTKKGLPKGRQSAMKHILSYKSCYSTRPSSGHDQSGLLTAKTSA